MPAAWSAKDERQYKHILKSCGKRRRGAACKRIAAATVNKTRRSQGRTLGGLGASSVPLFFAAVGGTVLLVLASHAQARLAGGP